MGMKLGTYLAILAAIGSLQLSVAQNCLSLEYTVYGPFDNFGECSSQGVCTTVGPVSTCECGDGWTGRSDFLNTDGLDCQINNYAIIGLWVVSFLFTAFSCYKSYSFVVVRYNQYKKKSAEFQSRGKKLPISSQKALIASFIVMGIAYPAMFSIAILRIAKWDERVGVTFGMTFLFGFIKLAFYYGNYLYSPALLSSLLGGAKFKRERIKQLIRYNEIGFAILTTSSIVAGFLPFLAFFVPGELGDAEQAAWIAYLCIMIATMVSYTWLFNYIKNSTVAVLDESISITNSDKTKELKGKLVTFLKTGRSQSLLQVVVMSLFLFWPYLWNKHDYFLPLSWLAFTKLGRDVCTSTIKEKSESSKLSGSKGSKGGLDASQRDLSPMIATYNNDKSNVSASEEYI